MMRTRRILSPNSLCFLVLFLFVLLCLFMTTVHENWRDEAQAWMMAKELSPLQLFKQMKFEGHPCLWHLILMPFAKAGFPYVTMNIISTLLVSAAVAVFLFKSPVSLWVKLLGICGSAFWYYYAVISRSYSLIPVLLFLSAAFYKDRHDQAFRYCFCLAGLVQTHVIMLPFPAILSIFFMFEALGIYFTDKNPEKLTKKAAALLLPLVSFLLFIAQIWGVEQSSAFQPIDQSSSELGLIFFQNLLFYWTGFDTGGVMGVIFGIIACIFLLLITVYFRAAVISKNSDLIKPFLAVVLTIIFQLVFSVFLYSSSTQRSFTWLLMWIWFMWVTWTHCDLRKIKITVLSIFILLSLPSYLRIQGALEDVVKPYSTSGDCANYILKYLPEDGLYFETDTAYFTALRPYLPDSFKVYSVATGENEMISTWQRNIDVIDSVDKLEKYVMERFPSYEDYWVVVPSGQTIPLSESFYKNGSENLVYDTYFYSISNEDYAILHFDLPFSNEQSF